MKKIKIKLPIEDIREIWQEMKFLKRVSESKHTDQNFKEATRIAEKYENVDILFGHESTLSKAIIYYLDERFKQMQETIKNSNK